jgi:hypothetical protein
VTRIRIAALFMALASAGGAAAQTTEENPQGVFLFVAASDADAAAIERVVRELLMRLHVEVHVARVGRVDPSDVVTPQSPITPALARVWVDLTGDGPATLYVVDGPWERVLVRHVERVSDEMMREEVGHILETGVDALLHGGRIGVEKGDLAQAKNAEAKALAPQLEKAPAPAPPTPALRGEVGLLYEAQLFGPGGIIRQGPELSLVASTQAGSLRAGIWITGQVRIPVVVNDAVVALRFDSLATRALAALDLPVATRTSLRFAVGGGLDFDHIAPRLGTDPTAQLTAAESVVLPVARASVGVGFRLVPHADLHVGLASDFDFSGTRYSALRGGAEELVFAPFAVRPALYLGVAAR